MDPNTSTSLSRARWWLVALAAGVACVCALAFWNPWTSASRSRPVAGTDSAAVDPVPLALPENPRVLIFGDSWTYGSAATLPTLGYAYLVAQTLDWDATVAGVRGSGYLKPGIDGGSYGERIAQLDPDLRPDLVIVQGSINDRRLPATGYTDAVTAAWNALSTMYPEAAFVILGPAPHVLPVQKATARIDRDLARLAAARGWWYISPVQDAWITSENYLSIIDTGVGLNHPSTQGHAYLADRLVKSLADLAAAVDVSTGAAPAR